MFECTQQSVTSSSCGENYGHCNICSCGHEGRFLTSLSFGHTSQVFLCEGSGILVDPSIMTTRICVVVVVVPAGSEVPWLRELAGLPPMDTYCSVAYVLSIPVVPTVLTL